MTYSLVFAKTAKRQFDALPKPVRQRLGDAIARLASDPRPAGVVKLSGQDRVYRVRGGDYRAIYRIEDEHLLVLIIKVGHRREVYREH